MIGEIQSVLKQYWGYESFRPLQSEAMLAACQNRDSLVVLPTGGGKSLCFQAPAITLDGIALVVSPLISLMKDQVDALNGCGIAAARLDSTLTPQERENIHLALTHQKLKILYLSPERLMSSGFVDYLKQFKISLFAIDEAHCVSMWGHDFRPEYRQLGGLKKAFDGIAIHAYTATATDTVRQDIIKQLHLENAEVLVGSFDRPNLNYKVLRRQNQFDQICTVIKKHENESGIVYCIRRRDVDDLCATLTSQGFKALPYHAGMENDARKATQNAFVSEQTDIVVATVAFGMGIDKSNVRYVVHAGMPKSIEHYQQESGRAGRDGLEADCLLLYSGQDFNVWKRILGDNEPQAYEIALAQLQEMYNFCNGVTCRHRSLVTYFDQAFEKDNCGACDICLENFDTVDDALEIARKIISNVARLDQRFGAQYATLVLVGSKDQRILQNRHDELSTYGLLSEHTERHVRDWTEQLVGQDCLAKMGEYNVIAITDKGWQVLKGDYTPRLLKPVEKAAKAGRRSRAETESWEGVDRDLFESLRTLRRQIAGENAVAPYLIFSDAALRDMARLRPTTRESFLQVHGVGQKKTSDYGERFIERIETLAAEKGLSTDLRPSDIDEGTAPYEKVQHRPVKKPSAPPAKRRAFQLFKEGRQIEQVAPEIERALSTTADYLADYILEEQIANPHPWLDSATYERVIDAAEKKGIDKLRPIYQHLHEQVSYEKIRIAIACLKNAASDS
jgi:ATP-dependent DNA helicase RecQ